MKYTSQILASISGAAIMILEIDGSRIIAPISGHQHSLWTCLIGVILGCLSIGYWQGGKIADEGAGEAKRFKG